MSKYWLKVRAGITDHPTTLDISERLGISEDSVIASLWRLSDWFNSMGKYGKMRMSIESIDRFLNIPGFCDELVEAGWVYSEGGVVVLKFFTDVSSKRKGIGAKRRKGIMGGAKCQSCGVSDNLELDHIVPVSRGGNEGSSNLQVLCNKCNTAKSTKTMQEFMLQNQSEHGGENDAE